MKRIPAVAALVLLVTILGVRGADQLSGVPAIDPEFAPGFAKLKRAAAGFIEDSPDQSSTDWKPNLQLWVGFKAVEGSKRTIYFVQLTTLAPPTNATGQPWQPILRTNNWAWSRTNKTQFVSELYPVRVRVFDQTGRPLKGGQTPMAWGTLTNGLMDLCRLSLETFGPKTNSPGVGGEEQKQDEAKSSSARKPPLNDKLMRAMGGGFLWMMGMFGDLQTVPTVADVWSKAQCAVRWPSAWSIIKIPVKGIAIALVPRPEKVTLAGAAAIDRAGPLYRLPVDLECDKRNLSRVEIIVGPAHGAEMLMAGIRSIRARHPTKPKQEFFTQVLAAGTVREQE